MNGGRGFGAARRPRGARTPRRWFLSGGLPLYAAVALLAVGVTPSFGSVVSQSRLPGGPRAVAAKATGRSGEAVVSYLPPTGRGASPITRYIATCSAPGRTRRSNVDAAAPFSAITVGGMVNGVTYVCVVRATNAAGNGPHSASASVRVGAPSAPRWISAKGTPAETLSVALGSATSFKRAPITGYFGTCTASGGVSRSYRASARTRLTTVRGITRGKAYRCNGRATDKYGAGPTRDQPTCSGSRAAVNLDKPSSGVLLQSGHTTSVCATGYLPGARVALVVHSTPTQVGTITADSSGVVDGAISIPSTVEDGSHTLIATGASPTGTFTEAAPVTVMEDITAPTFTAFAMSPTTIDTSTAPQTITVTATITDDHSGNAASLIEFRSPSGQYANAWLDPAHRVQAHPKTATTPTP